MKLRILLLPLILLMLTACQGGATPTLEQPIISITQADPTIMAPTASPTGTPESIPPTSEAVLSATKTHVEVFIPLVPLSPGQKLKIYSLQMFPGGKGWALGGTGNLPTRILYTQDNARTWSDRTPPEPAPLPGSSEKTAVALFSTPQYAWVTFAPPDPQDQANQPVVWRTSDGGVSWQSSEVLQGARLDNVYSPSLFFFSDPQHGWMMSHHGAAAGHTPVSIFKTTDGGATWDIVAFPMDDLSYPLHTCCQSGMIFFADAQTGLVARDGGPIPTPHVLRTTDGGVTWQQLDMVEPSAGFYNTNYCTTSSLQRVTDQTASVVMNCYDFDPNGLHQAFVYLIGDTGETGVVLPLPEPVWPTDWRNVRSSSEVQWLSPETGWLIVTAYYELSDSTQGYNATHIYQTLNRGASWDSQGLTYWQGQFSFSGSENGFAVARSGAETALVYTQDSGQSWSMLEPVLGK